MFSLKGGYESVLKLKTIQFTKISFERTAEIVSNSLGLTISRNIEFIDNDCIVILNVCIKAQDNSLNLEIVARAVFDISECKGNKTLAYKNTVAIMFPYVRSQVSLITTQPDMSPVIIPALNINALLEDADNELNKAQENEA
jgi:preprotein translocase subunit SecB